MTDALPQWLIRTALVVSLVVSLHLTNILVVHQLADGRSIAWYGYVFAALFIIVVVAGSGLWHEGYVAAPTLEKQEKRAERRRKAREHRERKEAGVSLQWRCSSFSCSGTYDSAPVRRRRDLVSTHPRCAECHAKVWFRRETHEEAMAWAREQARRIAEMDTP